LGIVIALRASYYFGFLRGLTWNKEYEEGQRIIDKFEFRMLYGVSPLRWIGECVLIALAIWFFLFMDITTPSVFEE